mmetsp:Transcript_81109/g.211420  ORF Transcript_81109/g.211420 Transcript_81109/m.211420 type:complete len:204 (+) Transcript_81109:2179-2790(+)
MPFRSAASSSSTSSWLQSNSVMVIGCMSAPALEVGTGCPPPWPPVVVGVVNVLDAHRGCGERLLPGSVRTRPTPCVIPERAAVISSDSFSVLVVKSGTRKASPTLRSNVWVSGATSMISSALGRGMRATRTRTFVVRDCATTRPYIENQMEVSSQKAPVSRSIVMMVSICTSSKSASSRSVSVLSKLKKMLMINPSFNVFTIK